MFFPNFHRTRSAQSLRPTLAALVVAALASGLSLTSAQATAAPDALFPAPAYVTLQQSNAVEELPSGRVCQDLPSAHYVAVSQDGKQLLVSSAKQPDAYLVNAQTCAKLATFDIGSVPQGVTISPNGHWGLAVSQGKSTLTIIDLPARKVAKTLHFDAFPHNSVFTRDSKTAYVTLQGGHDVVVLDMTTLKPVRRIATIQQPHNLDLSPDQKTLWVRDFIGHATALDIASGKQLAPEIPIGPAHGGIDELADGSQVYTAAIGGHDVVAIDPQTFQVTDRIDVGQGPHGVRSSPDSRWLYAAVTGTSKVAVIDAHTRKVVRQIDLEGKFPFWVAVVGKD